MSPDELTTIHLAAAGGLASLVALASLWFMHHGRIDVCKECPHCKAVKRRAEEAQAEAQHDYWHRNYGDCDREVCPRNRR